MDKSRQTVTNTRLPKRITLEIFERPFAAGKYHWIAAWEGQETSGPYGTGNNQREAINQLVDVTEDMLTEAA